MNVNITKLLRQVKLGTYQIADSRKYTTAENAQ